MRTVEFQRGNAHFRFAESDSQLCEIELFDSTRHSRDADSRTIEAHGRGKVSVFQFRGGTYALRHYRRGGWIRHITTQRFLWLGLSRTRPWREFKLLEQMHELGLPCPRPYACRVQRSGLSVTGSLITHLIPNSMTLAEYLAVKEVTAPEWFEIGRVIRRFHDVNIFHADLNAHNVLIDNEGQVYLLDFDKGEQRSHSRTWKFANLKRLQRSIMKCWMKADTFYFSPASWDDLTRGYLTESNTKDNSER